MKSVHDYIDSLFKLYDQDISTLERVIKENPASALARVILLKKYKEANHPEFEKLREETANYVTNIPWYLYLLTEKENSVESASVAGENDISEINEKAAGLHDELQVDEAAQQSDQFIAREEIPETDDKNAESSVSDEQPSEPTEEVSGAEEKTTDHAQQPDAHQVDEGTPEAIGETENRATAEHLPPDTKPGEESAIVPVAEEKEPAAETPEEEQKETETVAQVTTDSQDRENQIDPPSAEGETENKTDAAHEQDEPKETEDDLAFEPLYTIDYFASQGIKLTEADLKDDKLSQQVKSFTGWLKSMKKLHPNKLPEQDEVIEKIIQNASEVSNVESEVLTEAMAEVLVKQNKKGKAIEMYEKLSLKNPAKSAYFAAKIENLKTT